MSTTSKIEWTDATWNPLVGCTKVSPGCDHCYAETLVNTRLHPAAVAAADVHGGAGRPLAESAFPTTFDIVSMRGERTLTQPLRWRTPKRIFVNSLSDLFHRDVPDEFIARVFAVMALAPQHQFQLLTKRHGRMRSLLASPAFRRLVDDGRVDLQPGRAANDYPAPWPLPNVWLGVSVEDQQRADLRIRTLLDTPAAVRFLSCEPLLGPVNLDRIPAWLRGWPSLAEPPGTRMRIDWVIVGGESGREARPTHPDWARTLRDQCAAADVPYHFKQWGEWVPIPWAESRLTDHVVFADGSHSEIASDRRRWLINPGGSAVAMRRVGKKAAGRQLDGRTHDGYPHEVATP